jgi:hypothetical protein
LTDSGKECILPASVGNSTTGTDAGVEPTNPACITVKKTDTGTVDMPKGAEAIFDMMAGIAGRLMRMMSDLVNR